jgi:DNA end-binding protein Ku
MVARAIGTGTISFGLVSIPIKLFSCSQPSSGVSFNMLHGKCKSRLKQQYICPRDNNEVVGREDMVKGYEFQKDQYVAFTEEELKQLAEESTKSIDITEFVPLAKVDPVYFDGAYYLGPDKGGARAYSLLAEVMRRTSRCALAKWAARGKQYLVLVRPTADGLVMQQLLYADEVRAFSEVPLDRTDVREAELKLAMQLVEQISSDEFHPENYEDGVKKRILEVIQRKVEGQEVTAAATEEPRAQIIDLMEALKASLGAKAAAAAAGSDAASGPPGAGARAAAAPAPAAGDDEEEESAARKPAKRAGGGREAAGQEGRPRAAGRGGGRGGSSKS